MLAAVRLKGGLAIDGITKFPEEVGCGLARRKPVADTF